MLSSCLSVRDNNMLIDEVPVLELADKFSTPLYVMSESLIRKNCNSYVDALRSHYNGNGRILYASKAFCCKAMCELVDSEDCGLDVVSIGELYTALAAKFPADKIVFHGNNKTMDELVMAVENHVGRIVVDNIYELRTLSILAEAAGRPIDILLRIKPGIDAHTHDFIRTGQIDSKFGFALETGEAMESISLAINTKGINLRGLHCHIGSQIFDIEPYKHAAEVMLGLFSQVKYEFKIELEELNLGGGFGIKYVDSNNPPKYTDFVAEISKTIKSAATAFGINQPFLMLEPGRSIVGEAGITLYTVGGIKTIPNIRTYVSVNGSMCDNPRYALYRSEYTFEVVNNPNGSKDNTVTIAGKCCETGDLLGEGVALQNVNVGDTVAVLSTGAYNYSMASSYNRNPTPAVVWVNGDNYRVVVNRQTLEDIVRNDV